MVNIHMDKKENEEKQTKQNKTHICVRLIDGVAQICQLSKILQKIFKEKKKLYKPI